MESLSLNAKENSWELEPLALLAKVLRRRLKELRRKWAGDESQGQSKKKGDLQEKEKESSGGASTSRGGHEHPTYPRGDY